MAGSNAFVEKMTDFGLRHGEKVGVALASMAFFVCVGMAASQKTIETTPEQIKKAAQQSESNLNRQEKRETIIEKLVEKGIKDSDFAKTVEDQVKRALDPADYTSAREWVTPEPGAGLIRDTPVLIAVTELYAYPGRGGVLMYELDESGNRVLDKTPKKEPEPKKKSRRQKRVRKKGKSEADKKREAEEEAKRVERALRDKMVGRGGKAAELEKKDDTEAAPEFPEKEITKGYRWVVITGVLDHAKLVANYREALKNPAVAHPNYRRLDLQRQLLQADGSWTKWENVDTDERYKVLDNLPENDEELAPDEVRPTNLVDPLPFLRAGLWEKVHIASLVPKEKKRIPKANLGMEGDIMGMAGGDVGRRGGAMMGAGMMDPGMMPANADVGRMGGAMMPGAMMGAGTTESVPSWRSDAKNVMIRAFDFTAKEDETYRYRVRIVVFNPNKGREDVSEFVDAKAEELRGPWSQETDPVTMPPDVMPYVAGAFPPNSTSDMKVRFQVIRFNPADGVTVPHRFEASPGEVIGEPRTAEIPVSDGSGKKSKIIDFNSHQIVLDVIANKKTAGYQSLPAGFIGPPFVKPSVALVLRPDGSVVVHNEADDEANEVRKDIEANYKHEISLSTKKRENSRGAGAMGAVAP